MRKQNKMKQTLQTSKDWKTDRRKKAFYTYTFETLLFGYSYM